MKLAILLSGRGSNCEALLRARAEGRLPHAEFVLVLSNRPEAPGLAKAASFGVPTAVVDHKEFGADREAFEERVLATVRATGAEGLVLAGWMRVLGRTLLDAFPQRIVNVHPSLLPAFPGLHAQRQALDYGVRVTGCTVHLVDSGVDTGPILAQATVPVLDDDTEETLCARLLPMEHRALEQGVDWLSRGLVEVRGRRVVFNSLESTKR